jgi:DNA recombination protein RmuC
MDLWIIILFSAVLLQLVLLFALLSKNKSTEKSRLSDELNRNFDRLLANLKNDQQVSRAELSANLRENRAELNKSLGDFRKEFSDSLTNLLELNRHHSNTLREGIEKSFKGFQDTFDRNVHSFNELQREKFSQLDRKQQQLVENTAKSLEQMRQTVDEKLQKTLNERLGHSFEIVNKQLEGVQKGLGEMQSLAQDVGGLKRVLTNVKTRGIMGEIQLANILEQILTADQFIINFKPKANTSESVEFAIKLPGRSDNQSEVYLPIDSKFPIEAFHQLQDAQEAGSTDQIALAVTALENAIKKCAKDISVKYIHPPHTTDFAILFLPFESLYAEVVRKTSMIEILQRDYKIIITGPSTLAALLNSLQMGFRTLAIQKRSSEVWSILSAVKTEFSSFAGMLQKAKSNLDTASNQLDTVLGVRTRAIERKLKNIEALPESPSEEIDLIDNEGNK